MTAVTRKDFNKFSMICQRVSFQTSMDDIERDLAKIEKMGRLCHKSDIKKYPYDPDFIKRLICMGHESVLEHGTLSVILTTDIPTVRQLARHRLSSVSEKSMRYIRLDEKSKHRFEFIYSADWKKLQSLPGQEEEELELIETAVDRYRKRLINGSKPQDARRSLPLSLATDYGMTANLREWRHIFKLRGAKGAELQTRKLMYHVYRELKDKWSFLLEDIDFYMDDFDEAMPVIVEPMPCRWEDQ